MIRSTFHWKAWVVRKIFSFVSLSIPLPFRVRCIPDRHRGDQLAMTGRGVPVGLAKHLNLIDRILLVLSLFKSMNLKCNVLRNSLKMGIKLLNLDYQPQILHSQTHFIFISWLRTGAQSPNH